eukprot:maker-scaffold_10-snap-gene-10.39-mRNA-1 protein AED:0.02 eAED:0.02 QI:123/1/1/1/1/1/2/123/418
MSLTKKELKEITSLNKKKRILASGVVKLYLSSPNSHVKREESFILTRFKNINNFRWTDSKLDGGLVFLYDDSLKKLSFEIYHLSTIRKRFACELYENFETYPVSPFFFFFELDDCMAGFLFSKVKVAENFQTMIKKHRPMAERKTNFIRKLFKSRRKRTVELDEIGSPSSFQHPGHLTVNPDGTFDVSKISPTWIAILKEANVPIKALKNQRVAKSLYKALDSFDHTLVSPTPQIPVHAAPSKPQTALNVARSVNPMFDLAGQRTSKASTVAAPIPPPKSHGKIIKQKSSRAPQSSSGSSSSLRDEVDQAIIARMSFRMSMQGPRQSEPQFYKKPVNGSRPGKEAPAFLSEIKLQGPTLKKTEIKKGSISASNLAKPRGNYRGSVVNILKSTLDNMRSFIKDDESEFSEGTHMRWSMA